MHATLRGVLFISSLFCVFYNTSQVFKMKICTNLQCFFRTLASCFRNRSRVTQVLQAGINSLNCWPEHTWFQWYIIIKPDRNCNLRIFLSYENDKPNEKEIHLACPCGIVVNAHSMHSCHVPVLILTGGLCCIIFPYSIGLINTYFHYYSYTSCMLTNSELKSLLKQPGNVCELVFSFGPLATVGA